MRRLLETLPLLAIVVLGVAGGEAAAPDVARASGRAAEAPPRVTVIGDSVAQALEYADLGRTILSPGVDLDLQLATCRRVAQLSCPYNGTNAPNVLELVEQLGPRIGSTVVVLVGYNDFEQAYAGNIEDALTAFRKAGVTRVFWTTLRAARHPYVSMNAAIVAAAGRHPELTVVDWNLYSRSHPDWFQGDGIHLNGAGAEALATLVRQALVEAGIPAPPPSPTPAPPSLRIVTTRLPAAHATRRYAVRLTARGGLQPYSWSLSSRPPAGLHLSTGGRLTGVVRAKPGQFELRLRVRDASRRSVARSLALRIRR